MQRVERWQSNNGRLFETETEAQLEDARDIYAQRMSQLHESDRSAFDKTNKDNVTNFIWKHREIISALLTQAKENVS